MIDAKSTAWWFWTAMVFFLALELIFGMRAAIYLALALGVYQIFHAVIEDVSLTSFPVQVRAAYLGLLILGLFPVLQILHWIQLIGTTARVTTGYCLLARAMSLLPWNRKTPLDAELLKKTFFSPPVKGSIQQGMT